MIYYVMKLKIYLRIVNFGKSLEYLRNIKEFEIFGRFWEYLKILEMKTLKEWIVVFRKTKRLFALRLVLRDYIDMLGARYFYVGPDAPSYKPIVRTLGGCVCAIVSPLKLDL